MSGVVLKTASVPAQAYALTNYLYMHPTDFATLRQAFPEGDRPDDAAVDGFGVLAEVQATAGPRGSGYVFSVRPLDRVAAGTCALGSMQRSSLNARLDQRFTYLPFLPPLRRFFLQSLSLEVGLLTRKQGATAALARLSPARRKTKM